MNHFNLVFKNLSGFKLINSIILNRSYKVAVLGAAGSIGQPLSFFLKKSTLCTSLALYDIKGAKGVAADLSHIDRAGAVKGYDGIHELGRCLRKADIVVITAGVPRQKYMSRNERFILNATIVADLITTIATICPTALICIISDPINCTVPVAAEILKYHGMFDSKKLFGVTTLDIIRAITFISQAKNINVYKLNVPVMGGHSYNSMIPIISQCTPYVQFPLDERNRIVEKIRNAGTEVAEAKEGSGSATLSMSSAAFRFINSLMEAKSGKKGVIEPSFVKSEETECEYFSTPLILGINGIERNLGLGQMTEYEINLLKNVIPDLQRDIAQGKEFAATYLSKFEKRE